jgi:hypothetical protein
VKLLRVRVAALVEPGELLVKLGQIEAPELSGERTLSAPPCDVRRNRPRSLDRLAEPLVELQRGSAMWCLAAASGRANSGSTSYRANRRACRDVPIRSRPYFGPYFFVAP